MSRAEELVELIRGRIHSEFDGECHLTDTEAHAIADFLSEAERRARREALEEAAKTIEEGFDRGIVSKHDLCAHKKFEWEDCESCAANAVRALIPSEPHDAEGRE